MKRLGWLPPANARTLCDTLQSRYDAWLDQWSVSHGQDGQYPRVSIAQLPEQSCDFSDWYIDDAGTGGAFGLRLSNASHSEIGAGLLKLSGAADVQICGKVGEDALKALLTSLSGKLRHEACQRDQSPHNDRFLLRHGALHATAQWEEFEIELVADAVWCASQGSVLHEAQLPALTPRTAALRCQPVCLRAQLTLGEMELAEISTLRVGEVLVVDSDTQTALQLMNGTHALAAAGLVVFDGRRALELR
ncbi:FliM/FliN family flagellar motor switch protein [Xanthomonas campestris pv. badrii]|uniref:FliM/FliN family flagellar motor switch protein n=1 Tax=Xanthomonas campestris pv. badrii TaxID=149696 RepID=A0A7Z2VE54_XANCA|nr:FliM/FliN family flagellar motor switch protein [Xanthomonas campestris]QJD69757.1 FliM/FliN family flagellar motor switch protein [Xanthomonas campestris pv. badrii]